MKQVLIEQQFEVKCPFCGTWFPIIGRLIRHLDGRLEIVLVDYGNGALVMKKSSDRD